MSYTYQINKEDGFEYEFSEEDINLFEERRVKRLSGESKTYNWQDAKEMITGKFRPTMNNEF